MLCPPNAPNSPDVEFRVCEVLRCNRSPKRLGVGLELGVSERRVRQLARNGRVRGAAKFGQEWLIPTPVEVIPGSRGPFGIAGASDAADR